MRTTLGTNITALKLIGGLGRAQREASGAIERLGSGLRINRGADDPAGLAVASTLSTKARVLGRGQQNIGDAVSYLSIADGALNNISGLLSRMTELASQAANSSFSTGQRESLNAEYQQLSREIKRIGAATSFNGQNPFLGRAQAPLAREVAASIGQVGGMSADGRWIAVYDDDYSDRINYFDSVSGTTTRVQAAAGVTNVVQIELAANGNAVYSGLNGAATEVYYYNRETGEHTLLSNSINIGNVGRLAISADGSTVAFHSTTHYQNGETSSSAVLGGSYRIAVVDVATGIYRTNSLTVAASTNIQQSSDGRFLTFNSGNNPLGTNADGNSEVFVGRIGDSLSLEQLTNTTGGANFALAITNSGLVTLQSNRNLSGTNSGLYNEFFQAYAGSQAFTQISTFQTAAIFRASVSTDGSTISFISSQNLTGENADGSAELFRLDSDLGRVLQMTSGADFNGEAFSLLADGSRVLMQLYDDGPVWVYDTSRAGTFVDFEVGAGESGRIAFDLESLLSTVQGLGHYDLSSAAMARLALDHARTRVADVALLRGTLGAQQSRLAVAESLVTSQRGELTVAEARLSNADIAVESATLLRAQILSQTGAALLGQANQQPQIVLRLLQQP